MNNENMIIECYDYHEVINFTEDDIIDGWYVICPCCEEKISILNGLVEYLNHRGSRNDKFFILIFIKNLKNS